MRSSICEDSHFGTDFQRHERCAAVPRRLYPKSAVANYVRVHAWWGAIDVARRVAETTPTDGMLMEEGLK